MRTKSPRAICLDILNRTGKGDLHPDRLLTDAFKRYRFLTSLDRGFLTELTYGVVRWRGKLDWVIGLFSKIPMEKIEAETQNILRLGLYQILFLTRTPVSAAVNESVELSKKIRGKGGAGFVNAVLREAIRKKEEIRYPALEEDPIRHLAVVQSTPLWLVRRWVAERGLEEAVSICTLNNRIAPLTLRTNTLKTSRLELIEKLAKKTLYAIPTHYSEDGIILKESLPTSELPFLREGLLIIQDEASQCVSAILEPQPGERILDACAAPGSKTTHLAQMMKNQGEIYALDLNREKLNLIEEACLRLGVKIVKTVKADATRSLPMLHEMKFNRVLADVPCSGFGTLRKHPDLKWKKGEEALRRLSALQSALLDNLSNYVQAGGVLVYSTCTIFREENEEVVERFLEKHPEFQIDSIERILSQKYHPLIQNGYFKTFPPKEEMDGFFAARMIKKAGGRE